MHRTKDSPNYHLLQDGAWLRSKYIDDNLSIQKIADSIGVKYHAVRSALIKAGVAMKPQRIYGFVNHPDRKGEKHPKWKGGKPKCLDCDAQVSNYDRLRCRSCYLKHNRGENHPAFKAEKISPENVTIRNSEEYRNWRTSVFAKYNYKCHICNKPSKNLNAHHLDSFHAFPEKRFDVENGVCLCSEHHIEFHLLYGRKSNTKDQFIIYQRNKKEAIKWHFESQQ